MSRPTLNRPPQDSTLLWIGTRDGQFRAPYQDIERSFSQTAYRETLEDALRRPPEHAQCCVLALAERVDWQNSLINKVLEQFSDAIWICLEGSLSRGSSRRFLVRRDLRLVAADCWNGMQTLEPGFVRESLASEPLAAPVQNPSRPCVAVISSDAANAMTLMEIADSEQLSAVWLTSPSRFRIRNVDVAWWDDSWLSRSGLARWPHRVQLQNGCYRARAQHVWITNDSTPQARRLAREAGIRRIVSKPYSLNDLLESVRVTGVDSGDLLDRPVSRQAA